MNKKTYIAPALTVHGSVENLTQSAPTFNRTDVPIGTPVTQIDDITS